MEQYVKGFKGFTPVKMCGLSPLASFYISLIRNSLQEELNKPDLLPVTVDLEMLRKHPLHKIVTCTATLKAAPTIPNWGELAEITLCQVITFHNRGGGEVSKMLQRRM